MKNIERAKRYQKKLFEALGRGWTELELKRYWEGGLTGEEWDYLYDNDFLENNFCAWCGNSELKSDYYRSPRFSMRQVRVPICDDCFIEATGGNIKTIANKSSCFIATAVLENPCHPDILLLKHFRDNYLSKSNVGRLFIRSYYIISPSIAKIISKNYYSRLFIKKFLINPILNKVKKGYYNM